LFRAAVQMTDLQGVGRAGWRRERRRPKATVCQQNTPSIGCRVSSMILLLTDTQSPYLDCHRSFKGVAKKLGNVEQR